MKNIDLKKFALHSQKLPHHLLESSSKEKEVKTFKLLVAHFADFILCFSLTSFMGSFYGLAFKSLLMTRSLQQAYSETAASHFFMLFLPVMLFSYFFSCYFLNHGQTWGMYLTKTRIEMSSKSFREAFQWAFHSFLICVSGGTYMIATYPKWKSLSEHDYLYHELLLHKDVNPVSLLHLTDKYETEEDFESISEAA